MQEVEAVDSSELQVCSCVVFFILLKKNLANKLKRKYVCDVLGTRKIFLL